MLEKLINQLFSIVVISALLSSCNNFDEPEKAIIITNEKSFSIIQDRLDDHTLAPELIVIPAGSNTLGDITKTGIETESPTYSVSISKPFAIGKYEISFDDYDFYCEETGISKPDDEGWGRGKRPVINITWDEAFYYTKWLSEKTGENYFLPSDAQWEYAARAGTQTSYWWGNEPGDKLAQCGDCAAIHRCKDCKDVPLLVEGTAIVGSYKKNPFGLYDVHGNVMEWVADCEHKTNSSKASNGSPRRNGNCNRRLIKDGSWANNVRFIRASVRGTAVDGLDYKSFHVGVRVARELN